jgi:PUL domain
VILNWPPSKRFPAIDIIRLAAAKAHAEVVGFEDGNIIDVLIEGAELREEVMQGRKELDTNALLVLRTFCNFFGSDDGKKLMMRDYEKVYYHGK